MKYFSHKIFKNKKLFDEGISSNKILLEKINKKPDPFNYKLFLENNQNREIEISSEKNFDNLEKNQLLLFEVKDVVSFLWKLNDNKILFYLENKNSQKLLEYWLYHTLLPIYFTFSNKYYFLHAGAIEIDNKAILFTANSYGGKSTLTNHFIQKKHIMISDDKVGVYEKDDKFYAVPSYCFHRPYRKAEDLGVKVQNFCSSDKQIYVIYKLSKVEAKEQIKIKELSGIEKFITLKHATDINITSINKKERFSTLSEITNNLRVFEINIPWDLDRLDEVYDNILKHIKII